MGNKLKVLLAWWFFCHGSFNETGRVGFNRRGSLRCPPCRAYRFVGQLIGGVARTEEVLPLMLPAQYFPKYATFKGLRVLTGRAQLAQPPTTGLFSQHPFWAAGACARLLKRPGLAPFWKLLAGQAPIRALPSPPSPRVSQLAPHTDHKPCLVLVSRQGGPHLLVQRRQCSSICPRLYVPSTIASPTPGGGPRFLLW